MGKVRKGRGGRAHTGRSTPASGAGSQGSTRSGQVLYCERCCQPGAHRTVADVRRCYGRGVVEGRDFRWVKDKG